VFLIKPSGKTVHTRQKSFKNVTRVGIADQQRAGKQGRDDGIKQFSTQLHPKYLSTVQDM